MVNLDLCIVDYFKDKQIKNRQLYTYKEIIIGSSIKHINKVLRKIYQENKNPIIIFIITDYIGIIDICPNQIIVRTSTSRTLIRKHEFVLPYLWECSEHPFKPLLKKERPIVGFCGLPTKYRKKLIKKIKRHKNIISRFVLRKNFWGGKPNDQKLISDFEQNIKSSHFIICSRGKGNFSMRFYQTLSMGRIPLLLDTKTILPFDKYIDYHDFCIIGKTENEIIDKLFDWWKHRDIIKIQQKCSFIFETYFKKSNYSHHLYQEIQDTIINDF